MTIWHGHTHAHTHTRTFPAAYTLQKLSHVTPFSVDEEAFPPVFCDHRAETTNSMYTEHSSDKGFFAGCCVPQYSEILTGIAFQKSSSLCQAHPCFVVTQSSKERHHAILVINSRLHQSYWLETRSRVSTGNKRSTYWGTSCKQTH